MIHIDGLQTQIQEAEWKRRGLIQDDYTAPAPPPSTKLGWAELDAALAQGNLNFAGQDARGIDFTRWKTYRMEGSVIEGYDFSGADLSQANLMNLQFVNCNFAGAKLDQAEARGAVFENCDMSNASLKGAGLINARFSDTVIGGADFTRAEIHPWSLMEDDHGQNSFGLPAFAVKGANIIDPNRR